MVAKSAGKFLFRTPNLGEGRLHDLSGARVRVGEHVGVDVQRDCGGRVPDPAAAAARDRGHERPPCACHARIADRRGIRRSRL